MSSLSLTPLSVPFTSAANPENRSLSNLHRNSWGSATVVLVSTIVSATLLQH